MLDNLRRVHHVFYVIGLAVVFSLLTAFSSWFRQYEFFFLLGVLVVFSVLFFKKNEKNDLFMTVFLILFFLVARVFFRGADQSTLVLRTSAVLAFLLLHVVLLIGPWSWFSDRVLRIYHYRRHVGVTAFLLALIHVSIIFPVYFGWSPENVYASIFTFYGSTALFVMFWLAVTSWDYVQKKVALLWWTVAHTLLLVAYIGLAVYAFSLQQEEVAWFHHVLIGGFVLYWVLMAPYSIVARLMKTPVFGWKQVHVLVYVAYFSLLAHLYFGVLVAQGAWLTVIFFGLALLVIGSHAVGWGKRYVDNRAIYQMINNIHQDINENGASYLGVVRLADLEENKGRKTYVDGKSVALFKSGEKLFAMSNVCAHQKGPLYRGKLEYGMVECPWHYWTYNSEKGCTLGKEKYCVPVYDVLVRDGVVFVSTEPRVVSSSPAASAPMVPVAEPTTSA